MAKLITMLRANHTSGLIIAADASHPNKLKFKGILTRLDEASTEPPQGSQNHKILMPSDVAEKRLSTLIGMGVNYAENLDAHEITHKVGVIEKAWIKGNALWVSGYVWIGDFPDAEKVLSTKGLGMSMELTHVLVEDRDADPWVLKDFVFTGATFLRKTNAAYFDTEAIAASASTSIFITTEAAMPKTNANTRTGNKKPVAPTLTAQELKLSKLTASAAAASVTSALAKPLAILAANIEQGNKINAELLSRLTAEDDMDDEVDDTTAAGVDAEAEDDDENDEVDRENDKEKVKAKGKSKAASKKSAKKKPDEDDDEDDFDEDEDDADGDDDEDEDEDDVDSANALTDHANDAGTDNDAGECGTPGHLNEDAEDRGNTTTLEDKQGPIKSAKIAAKYKKLATKWKTKALKFTGLNEALRAENSRLRAKADGAITKVAASSREAIRQTLTTQALTILNKSGMDAGEMRASGQTLSTEDVDAILKNLPVPLDVENRVAFKRELQTAGLMAVTSARKTNRA